MAHTPAAGPSASTRQVVVFVLNDESYAVDITAVQEIIRFAPPRSVSGSDAAVRGVINLRGKIIPVCDLKWGMGLGGREDPETAKIVVVESDAGVAGLIVDDVAEVLTLTGRELDAVPGYAAHASFVDGVAKVGDRLILLLAPERLFAGTLLGDVESDEVPEDVARAA